MEGEGLWEERDRGQIGTVFIWRVFIVIETGMIRSKFTGF